MAEVSKSRLSLDLEEIERQLRHSSQQPGSSKSDPLAELARIVGQDDPFRALLQGENMTSAGAVSNAGTARREPSFEEPAYWQNSPAPSYQDHHVALTAEEEAILRGQHDPRYAPAPYEAELYYQDAPGYAEPESTFAPVEPRRSRKGLIAIGAVLGAAIFGAAGALTLRSGGMMGAGGEPPVIKADTGPSKVVPQNPGGVDIPNHKQIYERAGQDTQTRVVNREEQPLDVRQATRAANSEASGPGSVRMSPNVPSGASASGVPSLHGTSNAAVGILGEPRRVRTVSIRPDGTIIMPEQSGMGGSTPAATPPASIAPPRADAPPVAAPAPSTPSTASAGSQPPQARMTPPQRPREATSTPTAPRSATRANGAELAGAPLQIADILRQQQKSETRSAAPQAMLREPTETSAAPAISPGFSVQLGVRNTEREGRAMFEQLQQRFASDLAGYPLLLRQAEINGKQAYRVRVGPMSRDDAVSLCMRLKASGGQCFVANN
jgi:SPOR domain